MLLRLLLSAVKFSAAKQTLRATLARVATAAMFVVAALAMTAYAIGFGLYAGYAWLLTLVSPPAAAGICAAAALAVALLCLAMARRRDRPRRQQATPGDGKPEAFEMPPIVNRAIEWCRANPRESALAAFLVGIAAGMQRR